VILGGLGEMHDQAVDVLVDWHERYRDRGVALRLVDAPPPLRERLRARFRQRGVFDVDFGDDEPIDDEPIIV